MASEPSHPFWAHILQAFGKKRNRARDSHTCVAALSLGKEGVNGAQGGSKDVGRREAEGRASQRKHLREGGRIQSGSYSWI